MQRVTHRNHWINKLVEYEGTRYCVTGTDWVQREGTNRSELQLQLIEVNEQNRVKLGEDFVYAMTFEVSEV